MQLEFYPPLIIATLILETGICLGYFAAWVFYTIVLRK